MKKAKKVKKTKLTYVAVRFEGKIAMFSFPSLKNAKLFMGDLAERGVESAISTGDAK